MALSILITARSHNLPEPSPESLQWVLRLCREGICVCAGRLHILKFDKNSTIYCVSYYNLGEINPSEICHALFLVIETRRHERTSFNLLKDRSQLAVDTRPSSAFFFFKQIEGRQDFRTR